MSQYQGRDFDGIYDKLVHDLLKNPEFVCSPRGTLIHEKIGTQISLHNPRARLLANEPRATNYGFAVGEFLWYWQGREDLEMMQYYNKRMKSFSKDGKTLNSAYGKRLRASHVQLPLGYFDGYFGEPQTQWEICKRTLNEDADSRRAVLHVNRPNDQRLAVDIGSPDVPCTLSLQFFIRDSKLHLIVTMRSNDVIWGLTYDLFSFTLLQECMLLDLKRTYPERFKDLELGKYIHTAGSMHLYDRHFELAGQIFDWQGKPARPMEPIKSLTALEQLCELEQSLRLGAIDKFTSEFSAEFFKNEPTLEWMLNELNKHKEKRNAERK